MPDMDNLQEAYSINVLKSLKKSKCVDLPLSVNRDVTFGLWLTFWQDYEQMFIQ